MTVQLPQFSSSLSNDKSVSDPKQPRLWLELGDGSGDLFLSIGRCLEMLDGARPEARWHAATSQSAQATVRTGVAPAQVAPNARTIDFSRRGDGPLLELTLFFTGSAGPRGPSFSEPEKAPMRLASRVMAAISGQFGVFRQPVLSQAGIATPTIDQVTEEWRACVAIARGSAGGRADSVRGDRRGIPLTRSELRRPKGRASPRSPGAFALRCSRPPRTQDAGRARANHAGGAEGGAFSSVRARCGWGAWEDPAT